LVLIWLEKSVRIEGILAELLSSSLLSKNTKDEIYRSLIWPVVLYGCEAWSLTSREELRLRVFENRVQRRIFGLKRDEVTG
jgi:hypothetical protein